jgi:DNA-binding transcriptional regulator YiaG
MNQRTTRLLQIMKEHELRSPDVARILNRKAQTVRLWRSQTERTIPPDALELLELKLRRTIHK